VDGFCHHWIFEVDDVSKVREMDADISEAEIGKSIEKFSFHIGWGRRRQDRWESL